MIITGAKSQLGKEVIRQFQDKYELWLYDRNGLDITDFDAVERLISGTKPDVLINAAAYTNVEKAEDDPNLAFRVNALGAHNLALVAYPEEIAYRLGYIMVEQVLRLG